MIEAAVFVENIAAFYVQVRKDAIELLT